MGKKLIELKKKENLESPESLKRKSLFDDFSKNLITACYAALKNWMAWI